MKKICPVCSKPFIGRSDKRFCSTACKNSYHNAERKNHITHAVDCALHTNRSILQQLLPENTESEMVTQRLLKSLGFNFDYATSVGVSPEGQICRMIYEFSWTELEDDHVLIQRALVQDETCCQEKGDPREEE